jgi:hypothetical protein
MYNLQLHIKENICEITKLSYAHFGQYMNWRFEGFIMLVRWLKRLISNLIVLQAIFHFEILT